MLPWPWQRFKLPFVFIRSLAINLVFVFFYIKERLNHFKKIEISNSCHKRFCFGIVKSSFEIYKRMNTCLTFLFTVTKYFISIVSILQILHSLLCYISHNLIPSVPIICPLLTTKSKTPWCVFFFTELLIITDKIEENNHNKINQ